MEPFAPGAMVEPSLEAAARLKEDTWGVINARFVKPLDEHVDGSAEK